MTFEEMFDVIVKENKELQNENQRLREVIKIKDNERVNLVNENNYLSAELTSVKNDYKQSVNEIALLNRQLDRQTTSVNVLSDIVETSYKVIDALKKENNDLKLRHKKLTKSFLNSVYGFADTVYEDTDSIKETKDNDGNN